MLHSSRRLLAGIIVATTLASPAIGQDATLIDGSSRGIDSIIEIARNFGSATFQTQANGNPRVSGRIDGVPYFAFFQNCSTSRDCQDVNFFAGFLDAKVPIEQINEWNRTKRFGRAYLDPDGDAVIEMDVNLQAGVSSDNISATFNLWRLMLVQFSQFVGYSSN